MMTDRLFDALEICLQKLEQGQTIDSVLELYPDFESELRPILEASLQARTLAVPAVPSAVQRRGRARLLQHAAELRQSKHSSSKRMIAFFPRMAVALGLSAALILSSTGLVGASSNSLPGDQLYPVKRTWEGFQLAFIFNQQARAALQSQFEQERLNEIDELLVQDRSQPVTFSGLVIKRQDGKWLVSGIPVLVTNKTLLSSSQISDNIPVMVVGTTRSDGVLEAETIQSLQPGSMLPPLEPVDRNIKNNENPVSTVSPIQTESPNSIQTPIALLPTPQSFSYTGIVQGEDGTTWKINGQNVSVDQAGVTGNIRIGDAVRLEGYYGDNGNFVVTKIESDSQKASSSPNDGNKSSGGSSGSSGGDSNGGNNNNGGGDNQGSGGDGGSGGGG